MESQVVYYGCLSQGWKSRYFRFWSKISQNKFKLRDRVWISYGQNYVFFTSYCQAKSCTVWGFQWICFFFNFRSQITLKILCFFMFSSTGVPMGLARVPILCFFMFSSTGVPMGLARVPKISNLERFLYFWWPY